MSRKLPKASKLEYSLLTREEEKIQ